MIAYKLRDWVDRKKLSWATLSLMPIAINILEDRVLVELELEITGTLSQDNISWNNLSRNPAAIHLLEAFPENINWDNLSRNPAAGRLLEANIDKIVWKELAWIPEYYHLFKANIDKIDLDSLHWNELSRSSTNIQLLEDHFDRIRWWYLSQNEHAMSLINARSLEEFQGSLIPSADKINWERLSFNKNAEELLKTKPDDINYESLCFNESEWAVKLISTLPEDKIDWFELSHNPYAIQLLEAHIAELNEEAELDEFGELDISWRYGLSINPNAVDILLKNPHLIDWVGISCNSNPMVLELFKDNYDKIDYDIITHAIRTTQKDPCIFELDYKKMKATKAKLHADLIEELYKPIRIQKHLDTGMELEEYLS